MTRAFLLPVAAATALSGCFVSDRHHNLCDGAANFYWQFQDGRGVVHGNFTSANSGCFDAGVDGIDVVVDGARHQVGCVNPDQTGARSPAIQIAGLGEGTHSWTVEGFRGNEQVFATGGSAFVPCGADTTVDATLQALNPQSMVIYYSFAGSSSFCPAAVASMGYFLYSGATLVASSTSFACDPASLGFTVSDAASRPLPLFFGSYTAIVEAYDRFGAALYTNCNAPLQHDGAVQFVDLAASSVLCP